jgi:uncharacterized protein YqjF (DUF2071 family)
MGLPYAFASMDYDHELASGVIRGRVRGSRGQCGFAYRAQISAGDDCRCCLPGSLAQFAMERYSGFFRRRASVYVFRAWHPAWLQTPLHAEVEDDSIIAAAFPWFRHASFAGAQFSPGCERVGLGLAHRLRSGAVAGRAAHRLGAFYRMP